MTIRLHACNIRALNIQISKPLHSTAASDLSPRHRVLIRDEYSPTSQERLPSPDAKERTALLAVPYIASLESDSGCPALSHLLDARETGAWPFDEGKSESARGGSFLSGARSGAWCARRPHAACSLACCSPSLPILALRGAGAAPEFKRTGVVEGKANACRVPSPP